METTAKRIKRTIEAGTQVKRKSGYPGSGVLSMLEPWGTVVSVNGAYALVQWFGTLGEKKALYETSVRTLRVA